jgi:hypothetical protein
MIVAVANPASTNCRHWNQAGHAAAARILADSVFASFDQPASGISGSGRLDPTSKIDSD